jgi:hypothetical protein
VLAFFAALLISGLAVALTGRQSRGFSGRSGISLALFHFLELLISYIQTLQTPRILYLSTFFVGSSA